MDRLGLICRNILEEPYITQRELAKRMELSLGTINGLIKECAEKGYIREDEDQRGNGLLLQKRDRLF